MASPPSPILLFLFASCLLCLCLARAQQDRGEVPMGSTICASKIASKSSWLSRSGRFAFGFYPVGSDFAVGVWLVRDTTIIWTFDRDGVLHPEGARVSLTEDGLKLSNTTIPGLTGDRPIGNISSIAAKLDWASMLDSGNFVIEDVNKNIVWQTFDNPTDILMASQILGAGQRLVSSNSLNDHRSGRFQLLLRDDGELLWSPVNSTDTKEHGYWFSDTSGDGYNGVIVDADGWSLIRIENATNNSTLNQSTSTLHFARMEPDGYLRTYSTNDTSTEQTSQTPGSDYDKCLVKGTCGANSFCKSTYGSGDSYGVVNCLCLPGYVYVDPNRRYMGCLRNFSIGQCVRTKETNLAYSISRLAHVGWDDDPYNYSHAATDTECSNSCLEDCNCYAALYYNQRCSKQRQPLLYSLWNGNVSIVAILKVGFGEPPPPPPPVQEIERKPSNKILFLTAALVSVLVVVLSVGVFFLYTSCEPSYQKQCRNMDAGMAGGMAPQSFTYRQLKEATCGFKTPIGEGSFSTVYKGEIPLTKPAKRKASEASLGQRVSVASTPKYLWRLLHLSSSSIIEKKAEQDNHTNVQANHGTGEVVHIAVKVLRKMNRENKQSFRTEMRAAGRAHHRNIVRLLGFCHEGPKFILVYQYASKGSLSDLIFAPEKRPSWRERVDIALDVARGLHYLHEGCGAAIIHGDIKPQNVVVDTDGTAKITDLGIAKALQPWESKAYTKPRGTSYYRAPEWTTRGSEPVTHKVDVYSFGVVLLELVACRAFVQKTAVDDRHRLSEQAFKLLTDSELYQLIPEGRTVEYEELKKMVVVALFCLSKAPENRLEMKDVVRILGGKMNIPAELPPDPIVAKRSNPSVL